MLKTVTINSRFFCQILYEILDIKIEKAYNMYENDDLVRKE